MLGRALTRFEGYPDRYFGFDLGRHRQELQDWLGRIRSDATAPASLDELPKWRFELG